MTILALLLIAFFVGLAVFEIAALWILFRKGGQPGWGTLIPIFNLYLWLQMANRPAWWLILYIIPLVNVVIAIIVHLDVARAFGKSTAYGILFILFGFVVTPILAFGESRYTKPLR